MVNRWKATARKSNKLSYKMQDNLDFLVRLSIRRPYHLDRLRAKFPSFLVHLLIPFSSYLFSFEEESQYGEGAHPDSVEYDCGVHVLRWARRGRGAESTLDCE